MYPYHYDRAQPTPWLWVSEGITDYYADLVLVRAGLTEPSGFFATTTGKITNVMGTPPVALNDASLSTWIHPTDGTGYIYYDKGSLAGLMLDIMIRDASNNRQSLDDVMRSLYQSAYKHDRGFTGAEWWAAVSKAAGGRSFAEFDRLYVDGRAPYPWDSILPLGGMRMAREARIGIQTEKDSTGFKVVSVVPGSTAASAGLQAGDYLQQVGDVVVKDDDFGTQFRELYGDKKDAPLVIVVRRGSETLKLNGYGAALRLPGRGRPEREREGHPHQGRDPAGADRQLITGAAPPPRVHRPTAPVDRAGGLPDKPLHQVPAPPTSRRRAVRADRYRLPTC